MPKPDDVGVGTAMIVLDAEGRVLLGRRLGAHRAGHWSCPGGWLDRPDEATSKAAIRETLEEAGITVHKAEAHIWTTEDHPELGVRTVTLYHIARHEDWAGAPQTMEPEKCSGWEWFHRDDLPEPLFPGVAEALERLPELNARDAQELLVECRDSLRMADAALNFLAILARDPEVGRRVRSLDQLRDDTTRLVRVLDSVIGPKHLQEGRFRNPKGLN